jgi:hypothetical protein
MGVPLSFFIFYKNFGAKKRGMGFNPYLWKRKLALRSYQEYSIPARPQT